MAKVRTIEDLFKAHKLEEEIEERAIEKVLNWVEAAFEEDVVETVYKPSDEHPGRHIIIDSTGDQLTVWYDAAKDKITVQG